MSDASQRNWFPVIVAGLTILLGLFFYSKYHPDGIGAAVTEIRDAPTATSLQSEPTPTDSSYQSAVTSIMTTYSADKKAQSAYDALVLLHVPSSMQQLHIDLIIALGKILHGDVDDGATRLTSLHAQYSWLPL